VSTTLDGKALFDERDLRIAVGPLERAAIERSIPGLDGLASIDLGVQGRKVRQRGILRATSREQMDSRLAAIESMLDGATHTLQTSDGRQYADLRIDAFKELDRRHEGSGVVVEYEIVYTQLRS
jgi:hypothetical protein